MTPKQKSDLEGTISSIAYTGFLAVEVLGYPSSEEVLDQWAQEADLAAILDVVSFGGHPPSIYGVFVDQGWNNAIGDMVFKAIDLHPEIAVPATEHLISLLSERPHERLGPLKGLSNVCDYYRGRDMLNDLPSRVAFLLKSVSELSEPEAIELAYVLGHDKTQTGHERLIFMQEQLPINWTNAHKEVTLFLGLQAS